MLISFDFDTIGKRAIAKYNLGAVGNALIEKAPELRAKNRKAIIVPLESLNLTAYISYRKDESDPAEDHIIVSTLEEGLTEDSED